LEMSYTIDGASREKGLPPRAQPSSNFSARERMTESTTKQGISELAYVSVAPKPKPTLRELSALGLTTLC
jgi:hypothetical protein